MPRFEVRLESLKRNRADNLVPDLTRHDGSAEYRVVRLVADDEDAARVFAERREYELAGWAAPPERVDELQALIDADDSDDPKVALSGVDRAHWFIHHQQRPYEVVSITPLEDR